MLRRSSLFLFLFILLFGSYASAQGKKTYTPGRGTPERQAITDALRARVQRQLKKKVVFKIDGIRVQDKWAFLRGVPQQQDGSAMDYRGTVFQDAVDSGAFDNWICALLRKRGNKWQVVDYVLGATDVPYVGWDKKYRAPAAIFEDK